MPYSTVKKHARALGYTPKAGDTRFKLAAKIPHG
jgi:hypothetical protein